MSENKDAGMWVHWMHQVHTWFKTFVGSVARVRGIRHSHQPLHLQGQGFYHHYSWRIFWNWWWRPICFVWRFRVQLTHMWAPSPSKQVAVKNTTLHLLAKIIIVNSSLSTFIVKCCSCIQFLKGRFAKSTRRYVWNNSGIKVEKEYQYHELCE